MDAWAELKNPKQSTVVALGARDEIDFRFDRLERSLRSTEVARQKLREEGTMPAININQSNNNNNGSRNLLKATFESL